MIFTTAFGINASIIGICIGLLILAIPFIWWLIVRPSNQSGSKYCTQYDRSFECFANDHITLTIIAIFIGLLAIIIFSGLHIDLASKTRNNKMNEPAIYQQMMVERTSIVDALEVSDDVVNTYLYTRAVDYNSRLAEMQVKSVSEDYKHNFTGDYDWSVIQYIDLKGELGK